MKKYLKIINVTRRQLSLFIAYLLTTIFASIGILTLMNQSVLNNGYWYIIYDQTKFNISLILPLVFFILFFAITLVILLTGKERYWFEEKLLNKPKRVKAIFSLAETIQLILWAFFLIILITYFYPINQSTDQIYQTKISTTDFNNDQIHSGLLSFVKINNNFFADLKVSIINYAAIVPYFYNKSALIFWNVVYLVSYLSLFLVYLKLSVFKQKQRVLALIPFIGLFSYLRSTNKLIQQPLFNQEEANLKWYQKILQSNETVFQIKLTSTITYLSLVYLFSILGFAIFAISTAFIDPNGYQLRSTNDNNAYVIDLSSTASANEESWVRIIGTSLLLIPIVTLIGFTIGILLDKSPYLLSQKVRRNKLILSLTLIIIEITQLLSLIILLYFFIFIPNILFVSSVSSAVVQVEARGIMLSKLDLFMIGISFMLVLYLSWFLIYVKAGIFSKESRILALIPFSSLFFIKKKVVESQEKINGTYKSNIA
ncbi:hypothetical protein ABOD99_00910 [Mycoplasmoides gallisepticum]|uniref:hypothetical protein n=1 Tax=Mycoplasmoides gallisepticum TaxID=2096 RepID=UPI003306906E